MVTLVEFLINSLARTQIEANPPTLKPKPQPLRYEVEKLLQQPDAARLLEGRAAKDVIEEMDRQGLGFRSSGLTTIACFL